MNKKKALVLGATGQDGSYMIDLLLKKNIKFMDYTESLRLEIQKILII